MADHVIPHFHNDSGVARIEIGVREFMCVGAKPPFDHPHIFIDLGEDDVKRQSDVVQKTTDATIGDIDALVAAKEKEIMQV